MKKIIFFDIDGTIVTVGQQGRIIPQSTIRALHLLQKNGHLCFINSGRSMAEIGPEIIDLGFDGYICGCGTYITHKDKVLLHKTIPFSLGNELIQDFTKWNLEWILEGESGVYFGSFPYKTHIGDFKREHKTVLKERCHILEPEETKNIPFDKFCLCVKEDSNFDAFYEKYKDSLTFINRKNSLYEITPAGYSKASGMEFLFKHFDIAQKDSIAIGDSENDIPMLNYAGFSIVMGNSSKELLPLADYVTTPILEDGIYRAMEHLCLL